MKTKTLKLLKSEKLRRLGTKDESSYRITDNGLEILTKPKDKSAKKSNVIRLKNMDRS